MTATPPLSFSADHSRRFELAWIAIPQLMPTIPSLTTSAKTAALLPKGTGLEAFVPTLLRFLTIIGILVGLFYRLMFACSQTSLSPSRAR